MCGRVSREMPQQRSTTGDGAEGEEMIEIRELEPGHFERILPLLNAYKQEIGEAPQDKDGANRIREAIRNGRISFFVAQEGETPVGMCSLSTAFSTFAGGKDMGVFEDFYVIPEKRKQGIAMMLANMCLGKQRKETAPLSSLAVARRMSPCTSTLDLL